MKFLHKAAFLAATGIGMAIASKEIAKSRRKISFKDKVVFLTGGSRGLGLVMARQLLEAGAKIGIASHLEDELKEASKILSFRGSKVVSLLLCDVKKQDDVGWAINKVERKLGPIDILINNAGVIVVAPNEEMDIKEYKEAIDTHFWGPLYAMRALIPEMKNRGGGRIANISSIAGKISIPHQVPYSASKAALTGLSKGYRAELKENNIFVTTVCPGLIRTGAHKNAKIKGQYKQEYNWFSFFDASTLTTMSTEKAASKILDAISYGEGEVIMPFHARMGIILEGLFPGIVSEIFAGLNKILPKPTKEHTERTKGKDIEPSKLVKYLSRAGDKAAGQNNEFF